MDGLKLRKNGFEIGSNGLKVPKKGSEETEVS